MNPNKTKTRQETQNSETKNRGAGVEHRGMCVEYSKQTQNREQTQNSETKNRGAGVKHRGVCVECSKQTQNLETKNRKRQN